MYFMWFNFVENDCVYKMYAFIAHVIKLVAMGSVAGRPSLGLLSSPVPSHLLGLCGLTGDRVPADQRMPGRRLDCRGYGVQGGGPGGGRWGGMPYYF